MRGQNMADGVPDQQIRNATAPATVPDVPGRGAGPGRLIKRAAAALEAGDPVLNLSDAEFEALVDSMAYGRHDRSEHLEWTLQAIWNRRGMSRRSPAVDPNAPVPGCPCSICTRIAADHPLRRTTAKSRKRQTVRGSVSPATVEMARAVPILTVVRLLGIGEPIHAGREFRIRCPIPPHADSTPSFYINSDKGLWHCHGCRAGGDGIKLVQIIQGVDFRGAVAWLASSYGGIGDDE